MSGLASDAFATRTVEPAWRILLAATRRQPLPVRLRALLRLAVSPLRRLTELVPYHARVFDVGCGTGAFLVVVARTRAPAAVFGSEVTAAAAATAATVLANGGVRVPFRIFETADPASTGMLTACDVVTLIDVLHHIPPSEQQGFVERIAAALPAGGLLLLKEIDRSHAVGAWANRLHDRLSSGAAGHERSAATLEAWLLDCGLAVELHWSAWRLWYPHVTFVARKPVPEPAAVAP